MRNRTMTSQRHFMTRRLRLVVAGLVLYGGLWMLTQLVGAPQVRNVIVESMHLPPTYTELPCRTDRVTGPVYYCTARAYAPFLVRSDYGWVGGPLSGDGGSVLYFWFFSRAFRIQELDHWMV